MLIEYLHLLKKQNTKLNSLETEDSWAAANISMLSNNTLVD